MCVYFNRLLFSYSCHKEKHNSLTSEIIFAKNYYSLNLVGFQLFPMDLRLVFRIEKYFSQHFLAHAQLLDGDAL